MRISKTARVTAWLLTMLVFLCGPAAGGRADSGNGLYMENERNFVDNSMDVSHGIPENAGGVLARIRERGVLRVATEPFYAPQEFIDPDLNGQEQYAGADMQLARLIAERMGVELEIVPMDFTEVLSAVADDKCDLAIAALSFTPARASAYTLSKGYYFSTIPMTVMVIREEDAGNITSVSDLKGKTIIAQQGSLQETMVAGNVFTYKEFRRVTQIQAIYSAVSKGKADAGAVDAVNAADYLANNASSGLTVAENIAFALDRDYQGDRIGAKKGEYQLMYFVNGVIDEVLAGNLYEQWMEEARQRAGELGL